MHSPGFLCLKSTGIRMSLLCTFLSNSRPNLTPSCNHCSARIERDERRGIARRQVLESIKPSTFLGEGNFCAGGGSLPKLFCKASLDRNHIPLLFVIFMLFFAGDSCVCSIHYLRVGMLMKIVNTCMCREFHFQFCCTHHTCFLVLATHP